jgi:hypothetical protein
MISAWSKFMVILLEEKKRFVHVFMKNLKVRATNPRTKNRRPRASRREEGFSWRTGCVREGIELEQRLLSKRLPVKKGSQRARARVTRWKGCSAIS